MFRFSPAAPPGPPQVGDIGQGRSCTSHTRESSSTSATIEAEARPIRWCIWCLKLGRRMLKPLSRDPRSLNAAAHGPGENDCSILVDWTQTSRVVVITCSRGGTDEAAGVLRRWRSLFVSQPRFNCHGPHRTRARLRHAPLSEILTPAQRYRIVNQIRTARKQAKGN